MATDGAVYDAEKISRALSQGMKWGAMPQWLCRLAGRALGPLRAVPGKFSVYNYGTPPSMGTAGSAGLGPGAITGIVIGTVAAVFLFGAAFLMLVKHDKESHPTAVDMIPNRKTTYLENASVTSIA